MKKLLLTVILINILLPIWSWEVLATNCTAAEHDYQVEIIKYAEDDQDGLRQYTCRHCGDTYTEIMPRTGHQYGSWYTVTEVSCTHDGVQRRQCEACGHQEEKVILASGIHDYQETITLPTCTEAGVKKYECRICGHTYQEIIEATGHKWGEPIVVREATVEEEGLQQKICEHNEAHVLEETIPQLAENENHDIPVGVTDTDISSEPITRVLLFNRMDVLLALMNITAGGIYIFLIRRDQYVINWDRRKRRLNR